MTDGINKQGRQLNGYETKKILSNEDLRELRRRINRQICKKIDNVYTNYSKGFEPEFDYLNVYHELSKQIDHKHIWPKANRLLSEEDTEWFLNTLSMRSLFEEQGSSLVSDEEIISRCNFYWRLTRPWEKNDIGGLHRDEWFWILNNNFGYREAKIERTKIWIAIQTEVGKNGLRVVPGSHNNEDIEWEGVETDTIKKPLLKSQIFDSSAILLNTAPGEGVVFHDRLLHSGALNKGKKARCSIEFTILRYKNE